MIVIMAIATPPDFDDRHAVGVDRLVGFFRIPISDTVREEQAVVGILVVLHQQAAPRSVDREVHQAIIMHAPLPGLVGGAVAGILLERRPV